MQVFFYPDYTSTNFYQTQIYSGFEDSDVIASGSIDDAINYVQQGEENCIFHLHWPEPIFGGAHSHHDFNLRAHKFLEKIDHFRALGGVFIWTIHNLLPHDKDRKERQDQFQRQLSKLCDVIHVHSDAAAQQVLARYAINPDRIFVAAHGSYIGWYPEPIAEPKAALGYSSEQFVFGFLGQIRPYKGVDDLVDAFQTIKAQNDRASLFIAGKPVHPTPPGRMAALQKVVPGLKVVEGFVSNEDLSDYVAACDVVVLPYTDIFTSGSVMLAASFGKPVVLPDLPTLQDAIAGGFCWSYDPLSVSGLEKALQQAMNATEAERKAKSEAALRFAEANAWPKISEELWKRINAASTIAGDLTAIAGHEVVVAKQVSSVPEESPIGVIIVNYHSFDDVDELLGEVPLSLGSKPVRVVLVDNSERAEESKKLLGLADARTAVLIPAKNGGYAAGNNIGMDFAFQELDCTACVILNPDVRVTKRSLETLAHEAMREPARIVGPVVLKAHGMVASAGVRVESRRGSVGIRHIGENSKLDSIGNKPYAVDSLHGCAVALSRQAYDVAGAIPEDYFLYFEETQWLCDAREGGVTPTVVPAATVVHKQKSHNDGLPSAAYFYYLIRSNFRFWSRLGHTADEIERSVSASFIKPWLIKLRKRGAAIAKFYDDIVRVAIEDGVVGVSGRTDIYARLRGEADTEVVGFFDRLKNRSVRGWVAPKPSEENHGRGRGEIQVVVVIDDSPIAMETAKIDREDVKKAGHEDGKGFSLELPAHLFSNTLRSVRVLAGGSYEQLPRPGDVSGLSAAHLVWFPRAALGKSTPKILGRIDGLKNGRLVGWLLDSEHPSLPLHATLRLGEREVGADMATVRRPDVGAVHGGFEEHGFEISVPNDLLHEAVLDVELFATGGSASIAKREVRVPPFADGYDVNFTPRQFFRWSYGMLQSPDAAYERSHEMQQFFARSADAFERLALNSESRLTVSIIMPAYNRARVIGDAVDSVLSQSYQDFELIIVDDGSTDDTVAVAQGLAARNSDKVKFVALPNNVGVSAARNAGLAVASGEIIAYLDSDNQWYPHALACYIAAFALNPDATCVYGGQEIYLGQTNEAERRRVRAVPYNRFVIDNQNYIDLNVFAHRRQCLEVYGTFCEDMRRLVDWDLISRYTADVPPIFIPALLNKYYMGAVDNQITATEDFASNRATLEREREKSVPVVSTDGAVAYGAADSSGPCLPDVLNVIVRAGDSDSLERWRRVNAAWLAGMSASVMWWRTGEPSTHSPAPRTETLVLPPDMHQKSASGEVVIVECDMVVSPDWRQLILNHRETCDALGIMGRTVDNRTSVHRETPVEFVKSRIAPFVTSWGWQDRYHGARLSRVMSGGAFVWLSPLVGTMVLSALLNGDEADIDKILDIEKGYPFGEYVYLDTIRVVRR